MLPRQCPLRQTNKVPPCKTRHDVHNTRMNEREFDLIAKLIRSRDPARTAARLVIVSGYSNKEAAEEAGCAYNSVTNTVARFRATLRDIVAVFGRKAKST